LEQQSTATHAAALAAGLLVAADDDVKTAQQAATTAQQDYQRSLDTLNPRLSQATQLADGLRQATQNLYGAQISATEANESYEASWDALSASVGKNKRSLDLHTSAGRANRDALEALITSTNNAYFADIAAGTAIDSARRKHDNRIKSIEKEATKLGLDKRATKDLIDTYGQIPKDKTTNILLTGINKIAKTLVELYVYQRSLAEGIPLASARAGLKNAPGPDKRFGGFHTGGYTGTGAKYEPAGVVHRDEFVWEVAVAHAAFPGLPVYSTFRPGAVTLTGNRSYHAIGRAVDFAPSMPFAEWVNAKYMARTRELITPWQSLNIWNGKRHHYSALIENEHSGSNAHDHWAMANGGVISEPVFGVGASGDTYSFGECGRPETVLPGVGPFGTGGGTNVTRAVTLAPVININGQHVSPQQIASRVNRELGALIDQYARGN
jgi:hypothetical protein